MPDLVARLSGLHATLTQRLTLQESLLSLSGRLEMVISQIEMRELGCEWRWLEGPAGLVAARQSGAVRLEVRCAYMSARLLHRADVLPYNEALSD